MSTKLPTKTELKKTGKKAFTKATKTVESLAVNPTTYKVVGGLIVGYLLYKGVTGIGKKIAGEPIDDNVGGTGGSSVGSTITQTEANNYAQQLLDAFNDKWMGFYGTDDDTILAVFEKFKNKQDFIKVFNAFGTKDYNGNNSPPTGAWSYLDSYEKRNLLYWLKSELKDSTGTPVYALVKSVVNNAGFTF